VVIRNAELSPEQKVITTYIIIFLFVLISSSGIQCSPSDFKLKRNRGTPR
jgi:hypothetical protein